jgi:hypothetical protein
MIPTVANGQPAAAAYHHDSDGPHRGRGLGVLTVTHTGIARIFVFGGGPDLVTKFGLPAVHPDAEAPPLPQADEPTKVTRRLRCPWCPRPVMAALYTS